MSEELIKRLKGLSGSDGETDAYIWLLVCPDAARRCFWNAAPGTPKPIPEILPPGLGRNAVIANAPHYTASIDAALTLVPEGWTLKIVCGPAPYFAEAWDSDDCRIQDGKGATPAIAASICALRARAAIAAKQDA